MIVEGFLVQFVGHDGLPGCRAIWTTTSPYRGQIAPREGSQEQRLDPTQGKRRYRLIVKINLLRADLFRSTVSSSSRVRLTSGRLHHFYANPLCPLGTTDNGQKCSRSLSVITEPTIYADRNIDESRDPRQSLFRLPPSSRQWSRPTRGIKTPRFRGMQCSAVPRLR